jgi:hypothetical protein
MKAAAAALCDLKAASRGRALFKQKHYSDIIKRRDSILEANPDIGPLGAYQKAFKEAWLEADQEYWESQGAESNDNAIYQ